MVILLSSTHTLLSCFTSSNTSSFHSLPDFAPSLTLSRSSPGRLSWIWGKVDICSLPTHSDQHQVLVLGVGLLLRSRPAWISRDQDRDRDRADPEWLGSTLPGRNPSRTSSLTPAVKGSWVWDPADKERRFLPAAQAVAEGTWSRTAAASHWLLNCTDLVPEGTSRSQSHFCKVPAEAGRSSRGRHRSSCAGELRVTRRGAAGPIPVSSHGHSRNRLGTLLSLHR